jgi:hypothetical protein
VLERIGAAISSVQNWITRTVMQIAIGQSGLTREELDMAGIENEMRTDATREDESTAAANATAQQGQPVQQKVYELQQNLTRDEQNAVQGMADALQYIDALTEAERVLTEAMTNGNTYIDRVSPILRHELDVQSGGRAIDAAYVAPVSGYADSFISSLGNDGTAERARGQANTQFAQARAEFPGLDTSTFSANVGRLCGSYDTEYQRLAGSARTQAQQVKTVIQTYVGTSDYEGVNANAEALDQLATSFTSAVSRLTDALYAGINAVINDLMRQLAAASSSETPAAPAPPPDAPSTTASPAPAAEAPPAPAAE